eukprot:TRINITY_DN2745_c1_g2_i1.p1 TRINITY_DN2745_c1_g2~~TRINITY_DN2745_c1_g2_i1.p1  ORF type:complete len:458 (+),score=86.32 TRINITY_DN2745_c1_g2_i1:80-1453(+)
MPSVEDGQTNLGSSFHIGNANNPQPDPEDAKLCRKEWFLMCTTLGLNHATVTTPIIFASTVLTNASGQSSNAVLYGATLICTLFFSNPLFEVFGAKNGLSLAMMAYAVYVLLFALSSALCDERDAKGACSKGADAQYSVAVLGAFIGGLGAGLLWTAQGAFFSMVAERLAASELREKPAVTAELAGSFAFIFLGLECIVRALTTVLHTYIGLDFPTLFYLYAGAAALSAGFFFANATNLQSSSSRPSSHFCDKVFVAVSIWTEPKLWCLQATNLTFGFASAWLAGYVGREIIQKALSSGFIGFGGAIVSGSAALLAKAFGSVAQQIGKGPIILAGSICFGGIGILSRFVGTPSEWGLGALIFYALMGVGRAVYESTNKAMFADFFPGEKSPAAFANVFVFGTAASTVAFILGANKNDTPELYLLITFAALTFPGYLMASWFHRRESEPERRHLSSQA